MKKIIGLLIVMLLLTGCSNKKVEKKENSYYDLSKKELTEYSYTKDENEIYNYALADISKSKEFTLTGLFYKEENGYILLTKLENNLIDSYKNEGIYRFYKDKLYGIGLGNTAPIFEIKLNGKKIEMNELEFTVKDSSSGIFGPMSIIDVDDDNLKIDGYVFINGYSENKELNCNLTSKECNY